MGSSEGFQMAIVMALLIFIAGIVYMLWSFSSKLFSTLLIVMGAIILFYFPDMGDYQIRRFSESGKVIGALLVLLGILIFVVS